MPEESSNGGGNTASDATTTPDSSTTTNTAVVQDPVKPDLLGDLGGVNVAAENAKNSAASLVDEVVEKGAVDTQIKEEAGQEQQQEGSGQTEGVKNK